MFFGDFLFFLQWFHRNLWLNMERNNIFMTGHCVLAHAILSDVAVYSLSSVFNATSSEMSHFGSEQSLPCIMLLSQARLRFVLHSFIFCH